MRSASPDRREPLLPTTLVSRFLAWVRSRGGDVERLRSAFDLPPSVERAPLTTLPLSTLLAFCAEAERAAADPFLGVHAAEHAGHDAIALLAFACLGAPDGRAALERYVNHFRMVHDVLLCELRPEPGGASLRLWIPGASQCLGRHGNEHWAVSIVVAARSMSSGRWTPERVQLAHEAPRRRDELVRALGTTGVSFGAGRNTISFSDEILSAPLESPGAHLSALLERYARCVSRSFVHAPPFQSRVRTVIEERLPQGTPLVREVAKALAISPRTLQRRLGEEGVTFQEIVDDVRRDLARAMVESGALPLAEVASRVGYRQTTALFKSFQRWVGTTPSRLRDEHEASPRASG
jgi:AraC-like DNA-binding protein